MKFYSTNKKAPEADFETVLMSGLAPDGGLYMPVKLPVFNAKKSEFLVKQSFQKIGVEVAKHFVSRISAGKLSKIAGSAFNFDIPLKQIGEKLFIMELFHGPTLAFKDFGARFMARLMDYYLGRKKQKLNIIVATSGDTGSAVSRGFYGLRNIKVFVLYPSGRVTPLQEKQMASLGGNIVAFEVKGSFDDCQRLAKLALSDAGLRSEFKFSSANSINFGRLLPQSFYYLYGAGIMNRLSCKKFVYCVPSGNFGNLTAGLMAKKMICGRLFCPFEKFIAATNANDVVPEYLKTGKYQPGPSRKTISNAMDVGSPSNFARILELYNHSCRSLNKDLVGIRVSDTETKKTIKTVYKESGYLLDPHTAVGVAAAIKSGIKLPVVVLGTAHPAKFKEVIESVIGKKIKLPEELLTVRDKKKKSVLIDVDYRVLRRIILQKAVK